MLLLLRFLHLLRQHIDHFAALVVPAIFAHRVRLAHLFALTAGDECLFLQRQVAATAQLLSLGHMVSWNSHRIESRS